MISYRCDGCGCELTKGELRYRVKIDVRAAYDTMEVSLADLVRDHRAEMIELIEALKTKNVKDIEESVYKGFKLDLCPACQRAYIRAPLRFSPPDRSEAGAFDVDAFLRSMGIPHRDGGPESAGEDRSE